MGWNDIKPEDLEDLPNWKIEDILKKCDEANRVRTVVANASNGWYAEKNYDFTDKLVRETLIKIAIKATEKLGYWEVIKWV